MKPPVMISCIAHVYPEDANNYEYEPYCPACVEFNAPAVEEYRMYLAREARDRRIGCIGVVIAAVLLWSAIIAGFMVLLP